MALDPPALRGRVHSRVLQEQCSPAPRAAGRHRPRPQQTGPGRQMSATTNEASLPVTNWLRLWAPVAGGSRDDGPAMAAPGPGLGSLVSLHQGSKQQGAGQTQGCPAPSKRLAAFQQLCASYHGCGRRGTRGRTRAGEAAVGRDCWTRNKSQPSRMRRKRVPSGTVTVASLALRREMELQPVRP